MAHIPALQALKLVSFTILSINIIALKTCLIGAANFNPKAEINFQVFFDSLINYLEKVNVTITLTKQQVLAHNVNLPTGFFAIAHVAKLPNVGFDTEGNVYDLTAIRSQLKNFPINTVGLDEKQKNEALNVAIKIRNARKNEAEHRAWLARTLKLDVEKPELLLLNLTTTTETIQQKTLIHKLTIDFASYLDEKKQTEFYCNFMREQTYGNNSNGTEAMEYMKDLQSFLSYILESQSQTSHYIDQVKRFPNAPFSPTMMSYKHSYLTFVSSLLEAQFGISRAKLA